MTTLYFLDAAEFTDVSALAAVGHGRVVQYDKDALKVEPDPGSL